MTEGESRRGDSRTACGAGHNIRPYIRLYAGGKLIRQTDGTNTLDFFYDESGHPYAVTYNGTTYYYVTNLQGDVLHIVDSNKQVVASYSYDPYGKVLSATGSMAATLGADNPLRYRGYVYDSETGFYYLQSRYYDPTTCRFINADSYASTGQGFLGHNMFIYCGSNPANRIDLTGEFWKLILIAAVCVITLTGCTTRGPGAAPDYVEIGESDGDRDKNPNCYAYAIGMYEQSYEPGHFSKSTYNATVESVAVCVMQDLNKLGRGVRLIDGADAPIESNEYRIALRVSNYDPYRDLRWDYHFMVQTSSGQWAEKHGPGGATVVHASGTPDTISWDCDAYIGFYTSRIIYFAVTPPNKE